MKYKGTILSLGIGAAVITPIGLTIANNLHAYTPNDYAVVMSTSAPISSFNKFRESSYVFKNQAGLYTSSLLRNRPQGGVSTGLETSLNLEPLSTQTANEQVEKDNISIWNVASRKTVKNPSVSLDLAKNIIIGQIDGKDKALGVKIREDARFWNGDRVSAEDFIETVHNILNLRNAVPYALQFIKISGIQNAQAIWNLQTRKENPLSFEEAMKQAPLGMVASGRIYTPEEMATTEEGRRFYRAEEANGHLRHDSIIYRFEGDPNAFLSQIAGDVASTPTNIRHFRKVGLDDWGTSIDNLMGCGPYKPEFMDFDYKVVANKWAGYWDAKRVISPQIVYRVLPDITSQIQMFKKRKLGSVMFPAPYLKQFLSDVNLKKYVRPAGSYDMAAWFLFNVRTAQGKRAEYLADADFRKAISYSIDREKYMYSQGLTQTVPAETFTGNSDMDSKDELSPMEYFIKSPLNDIQTEVNGKTYHEKVVTRSPISIYSADEHRNNNHDNLVNKELAREYFKRFKTRHPEFTSIDLKFLVQAQDQDSFVATQQDIENTLPGVKVTIKGKPATIFMMQQGEQDYDITFFQQPLMYKDPWTFYHFLFDKVTEINAADPIARIQGNRSALGAHYNMIDYIVSNLAKELTTGADSVPNGTFAKSLGFTDVDEGNEVLAEILRMEATIGSNNPKDSKKLYSKKVWTEENPFTVKQFIGSTLVDSYFDGYKGRFNDLVKLGLNSQSQITGIENRISDFIENYTNKTEEDKISIKWKNENYRYGKMYITMERLLRQSSIGISMIHANGQFMANVLVGYAPSTGVIDYYGFVYRGDHVPQSSFSLPTL